MKKRILFSSAFTALLAAAIAAAALTSQARSQDVGGPPSMPPASSFTTRVDNPWFPLLRGTRWVYTGAKDGSAEMNIWLHKEVMRQLAAHGGKVPANLTD